MSENEVEIPFDAILWNIVPVVKVDKENGVLVELRWGWTAGFSEEELKDLADDAPTGYESIVTNLDLIEQLRDKLTKIIDQYSETHTKIKKEVDERFAKMFPNLEEKLERVAEYTKNKE